jgi:stearoyl-CoA desaturase (delta-9 desaturase)
MSDDSISTSISAKSRIPVSRKRNRVSFWLIHAGCLAVFWTGISPAALAACFLFYLARMFAITGWYHRYFSHRSFTAGRKVQFLFALLGCAAAQKGPLWWASHHREHHAYSDTPRDPHSPLMGGFWRSHILWFLDPASYAVKEDRIRDFLEYPELRWLERYHWTAAAASMAFLLLLGEALRRFFPALGTGGLQMLAWGFFVSTVLVYHGTFAVNSLGHLLGRQRYATGDQSRNSAWLAAFTLGEGWHNNHHRYPLSARQGFFWWEFDPTWYGLWMLERLGLIRGLRGVPERVKRGVPDPAPFADAPRATASPAR